MGKTRVNYRGHEGRAFDRKGREGGAKDAENVRHSFAGNVNGWATALYPKGTAAEGWAASVFPYLRQANAPRTAFR
jgi:hypothetical protein